MAKADTCQKCKREVDYIVKADLEKTVSPDMPARLEFGSIHKEDITKQTLLIYKQGMSISTRRKTRSELARTCEKEPLPPKTCPECKRSQGHRKDCSRNPDNEAHTDVLV